jgi:hypothetical protein
MAGKLGELSDKELDDVTAGKSDWGGGLLDTVKGMLKH